MASASQAAASGSGGGQPKQKVRARRGQATDPHSIAERVSLYCTTVRIYLMDENDF